MGYAVVGLWLLALCSGCGTQWLPTKLQADATALYEVRSIGKLVAQTAIELGYEGAVQITDILVLDLAKPVYQEALDTAHDRLRKQGWKDVGNRSDVIDMESSKWAKTYLEMGSMEMLEQYEATQKPEIIKKLKDDPSHNVYLVVSLTKSG
ncbi:hypothetical protein FH608_051045 [Nonomuraea phyllanthi]|uniref:Uncharacterized protein n=1 Tax=Nonomuraea phyllanthi TaxID=2219224 RepID=A0A5C4URB5_9ACTN|nr:hypothetical protein [Nonomuraea phyllanthi]KAB8181296.1 hypothetical protein FH608_051045 [Nonomuraea phyllanthi]